MVSVDGLKEGKLTKEISNKVLNMVWANTFGRQETPTKEGLRMIKDMGMVL